MSNSPFLSNCSADTIRDAAAALKAGHLVAFPTETVYGLGADARNADAVRRIYEVKGRPSDHPLIVHISSINQLEKWSTSIPEYAIALARNFWPGPMTLILKRSALTQDFITGGQDTVGLRIPSNPIALALIHEFEKISGSAIAAPSANRFGQVSPTCSQDVHDELSGYLTLDDQILDGGNSTIGIESTIVDCTSEYPRILRPGFITSEEIQSISDLPILKNVNFSNMKFSGSFENHYAPKCRVVLDNYTLSGAGFLALSSVPTPRDMVRIASPSTVAEFAQVLYWSFREADKKFLETLVVIPPTAVGVGEAVLERLSKASRGR
jgi:L-threonylcarbamoyladenylate synthase